MGVGIAVASFLVTAGSAYDQYKTAQRMERQQERQSNVQAGMQQIANRRESMRRTARERAMRASAAASAEARGAGSGSAAAGQDSGIAATAGGQRSDISAQNIAGGQLSSINRTMAGLQTRSARSAAVGSIAGSIFNVSSGSLFQGSPSEGIDMAEGNFDLGVNIPSTRTGAPQAPRGIF